VCVCVCVCEWRLGGHALTISKAWEVQWMELLHAAKVSWSKSYYNCLSLQAYNKHVHNILTSSWACNNLSRSATKPFQRTPKQRGCACIVANIPHRLNGHSFFTLKNCSIKSPYVGHSHMQMPPASGHTTQDPTIGWQPEFDMLAKRLATKWQLYGDKNDIWQH
jgi:hypothetical protein